MNLTEQLKELKNIKPRKDWVDQQRELLLSQIRAQGAEIPQSFLINSWFLAKSLLPGGLLKFVAQPIGVMTVLALFIFSSGMLGVNASKGSLPGDLLYSVKLTREKMQVGLTSKEEKKAELHVNFAEERVREIEKVEQTKAKPEVKKERIKKAADVFKQDMKKAQENLNVAKAVKQETKKTQTMVDTVKKVDEKTEALTVKIAEKKETLQDKEIKKALDEAETVANETGVKAIEVIVDKHVKGEVKLSENELVNKIEQKINQAEENIKQTETENQPEEEAKQILNEAKELLNQGKLSSAIEKVQQSAEIAKEAKEQAESRMTNE